MEKDDITILGLHPSPVASPDGKHIYAASDSGEGPKGIAFFERVGNELVDVAEPAE